MTVASRGVTFRDFALFQLKLAIDGLKDILVFNVSILAMAVDLLAGRGKRPRLFYSVLGASERFDAWLNLHGVVERMDRDGGEDGLFGASEAGSDSFLGRMEQWVRGGDTPRARGAAARTSGGRA